MRRAAATDWEAFALRFERDWRAEGTRKDIVAAHLPTLSGR